MANERVFFVSKPPAPESPPQDYQEAMLRTGGNTGNILFMAALQKQLSYGTSAYGSRFDPKAISRDFDYIAIPAANWIAAGNKVTERLAELLEQVDLPCLVAGIGAQSLSTRSFPRLSEGTLRFLKLISERSKVIGVRGQYTQDVMAHYGIKNAEVIGCPSYFWGLAARIEIDKRKPTSLTVAVNGSRKRVIDRNRNRIKRDVERALYKYAFEHDGSFVVPQTEEFEIHASLGAPVGEIPRRFVDAFKDFYDPAMHDDRLEQLREKFRVFTSVGTWKAELSKADFVVGTRLHGCVTGLLAGRPSLLISIDSRTKEIAEYLKIPTIAVEDVELPLDMDKLYSQVDLGETIGEYPRRFERYREFLEANGVSHNLAR